MVNTFFTSSDPVEIALKLDDRRLGKQRLEAKQIINALTGTSSGWNNHPCTRSWKGYTEALMDYYNIMVKEWIKRGKKNTMVLYVLKNTPIYPPWSTCMKIHHSHQARLIQKDPEFYTPLFSPPKKCLSLGYIWPYKWTIKQLSTFPIEKLSEPYKEELYCDGIKKNGKKCVNKALYDSKCGIHKDKDYVIAICSSSFKDGRPCTYKAKNKGLCGVHSRNIS